MRYRLVQSLVAFSLLAAGCSSGASDDPTSTSLAVTNGCETSQTLNGVDVYDGDGWIDWQTAKNGGIAFAFIKATQGDYLVDQSFADNWARAGKAGVVRSAYHFFDPEEDGVAQAQYFLQTIGTLGAGDLPAMLDLECPDGDPNCLGQGFAGDGSSSQFIVDNALAWLDTVTKATGKKPIIYTYYSYLGDLGVDVSAFGAYPLQIAGAHPYDACSVPPPWKTATFHQYDWFGSMPGHSGNTDLDHFNGTMQQLLALAQAKSSSSGTCTYGNGLYCGGNGTGGDPLTLYSCSGGASSVVRSCALGCVRMPAGQNDACAQGSACPLGNGLYCGGNHVGGAPDTLYRCTSGKLSLTKKCANGCARMSDGQNDMCN